MSLAEVLVEFKRRLNRLRGPGRHEVALSAVVAEHLSQFNLPRCDVDEAHIALLKAAVGTGKIDDIIRGESDIDKLTEEVNKFANHFKEEVINYDAASPAFAAIQHWLLTRCRGGPDEVKIVAISEELRRELTAAQREEWQRFAASREFGNILASLVLVKPEEVGVVDGYPAVQKEGAARKVGGEVVPLKFKLKPVYGEEGWWPTIGVEIVIVDDLDENGVVIPVMPNFEQ